MNRNFKTILIILATVQIALSQKTKLDDHLIELTSDIIEYEKDFKQLSVERGIDYDQGNFSSESLQEHIRRYATDLYDEPCMKFKFLFYHYKNDTLNIWLFNALGNVDVFTKIKISTDTLLRLENTLKHAIKIESLLSASRGGLYDKNNLKLRLDLDQSIKLTSKMLLPDVIANGLFEAKYLCILPCLNISSIPFGMLKPWKNESYLIDQLSYSFVHNLKQFFDCTSYETTENEFQKQKRRGNYRLRNPLIVGNPTFKDSCTNGLVNLPGAEAEANQIATFLKVKPLIGDSAIKTVIKEKMKNSTFIYLATHGYSDPKWAMTNSFLALYQPEGCGYLTPYEIQKLILPQTAIVVLSACESGTGGIMDAGVIGLARGFLKAGAMSVVMSLWNVNDSETKNFMLLFYEELNKPQFFFPMENLRQAVLRYRKEYNTNILFWSAFQNYGTPLRFFGYDTLKDNPYVTRPKSY